LIQPGLVAKANKEKKHGFFKDHIPTTAAT
jgi:hypothetical protein